jgi:hypothetical protein
LSDLTAFLHSGLGSPKNSLPGFFHFSQGSLNPFVSHFAVLESPAKLHQFTSNSDIIAVVDFTDQTDSGFVILNGPACGVVGISQPVVGNFSLD